MLSWTILWEPRDWLPQDQDWIDMLFYLDQKGPRQMLMGAVDTQLAQKEMKSIQRQKQQGCSSSTRYINNDPAVESSTDDRKRSTEDKNCFFKIGGKPITLQKRFYFTHNWKKIDYFGYFFQKLFIFLNCKNLKLKTSFVSYQSNCTLCIRNVYCILRIRVAFICSSI